MRKKHDHPRLKPALLGTNMVRVAVERGDPDLSQSSTAFFPLPLAYVPPLLLSVSLIDKDKANL